MLKMQDVSNWQKDVDIKTEAEQAGIQVIAIKATEGTGYVSPSFQTQWQAAKSDKLGRIAYHYLHPSLSAVAQARAFLNEVKNAGTEPGDCLAVDIEVNDGLTPAQVAENAVAFRNEVQKETKCSLIVYSFVNFIEAGNCNGLGSQPLWIADPSSSVGNPRVPAPWTLWSFQQYGTQKGIDVDVCNFDSLDILDKFAIVPPPLPLTPNQRMVKLTDGKTSKETLIEIGNLVPGFSVIAGDAVFTITQSGG